MAEIGQIQVGNLVHYRGPEAEYRCINVKRIEVEEEGTKYYWFDNPRVNSHEFIAAPTEVMGIYLDRQHLEILDFKFNEYIRRYNKDGLILGQFTVISKTNNLGLHGDSSAFKVIPINFPREWTKEQINELIEIKYLHSLQNYCNLNNIGGIDFLRIKQRSY